MLTHLTTIVFFVITLKMAGLLDETHW